MILELVKGAEFIQVTAQYSNAVMMAMLPHVSDFAGKLDLPVPLPITAEHVAHCGILPWVDKEGGMAGGGISIKEGYGFAFEDGFVSRFEGRHSYFSLQEPDQIPKFYGQVRMTEEQAVEMARNILAKLGIPLESVFAEQKPRVTLPQKIETNTVPHYRIQWLDPRQDAVPSVDIEINADLKCAELLSIRNRNVRRPSPQIEVPAPVIRKSAPTVDEQYAWKLLPIALHSIDDYGKILNLPIPRPLTSNDVAKFIVANNGGWPHSVLVLSNGWRFVYRNSMVNGHYAPDNLFSSDDRPVLIKEFAGKWKMTEDDAVAMTKGVISKLNYPTNILCLDFAPRVRKPLLPDIPRYFISWLAENEDGFIARAEAEVDAERREIKSLYVDSKAFWNHPPPIDVSIYPKTSRRIEGSESDSKRPQLPANHFNLPRPK